MTKINSLDDIVKNGLCIGCGLCKSIAGNSLEMEMSDKGNLEPKELKPISNETLEEIKKVCPGVIAEGPVQNKENEGSKHDDIWGYYYDLFYSWSLDPKIRFQSSTGGLLNGLSLYLLEKNKVDFIMHTAGDKDNPMRNVVKYSYNREDLLNCESRSRYGPSSPLSEFHKALDKKQTFCIRWKTL
jgi:coenzyme F420 hydrogenase subunit beta